ncbi:SpoIIE family protein phosphatase [Actinocrinis puniceicyclus]|uniref:SpoIIE family protein phosphatase n=1 Tax=Actinocrinis puniceicyclus TaxID=977794 RepID=A0A8J7WNK1_9ACTN|nr:SpoIIE family protein phosphatase [Actinocrinis puniceicyclus]
MRCGQTEAARQLETLAGRSGLPALELAADLVNEISNDPLTRIAREHAEFDGVHTPYQEPGPDAASGPGRDGAADREPPPADADLDDIAPADADVDDTAFDDTALGGARSEVSDVDAAGRASAGVRLRTAESGVLGAADTQAAAQSLKQHALGPLGATAVAIWALGTDGSLMLAGHAGFSAAEARRWRHVPPYVATLARRALVERRPQWVNDASDQALPSIGLGRRGGSGGRAALAAALGGRVLGVLEVCWPRPVDEPSPPVARQLEALAELCAYTLDSGVAGEDAPGAATAAGRAGDVRLTDLADTLLDAAIILRPLHDEGRLVDFVIEYTNEHFVDPAGRPRSAVTGLPLLEAYPLAAEPGAMFDKVEHVYATGEPFSSEQVVINARIDQVPVSSVAAVGISRLGDRVLLTWRLQDEAARLATLLQHAQRLGRIGGFEENLVTGETTWNAQLFSLYGLPPTAQPVPLSRLEAYAHPDDATAIGRFLRSLIHHRSAASTAFRLQRTDGVLRYIRIVAEPVLDDAGLLVSVRGACQDISSQHWTEIALAATRDQLAHTEQEAAERNRLALRLQRAIMPPAPRPIDAAGLEIAVRYRPAETDHLVGGDWYDAVVLPTRQILLVVGDVAGHGIDAATDMVALRNALRGLAATGAGPAQLLSWLNTVAHHLNDQVTATAVCGLYDPDSRTLRWARAGHPPPLLVRDGRATALPLPTGMLLGVVGDAQYGEQELTLRHGDTLMMYTDGLIERKDSSLDQSLEHLRTAAQVSVSALSEQLDYMLMHSNADTDDDTCLIGVHVR